MVYRRQERQQQDPLASPVGRTILTPSQRLDAAFTFRNIKRVCSMLHRATWPSTTYWCASTWPAMNESPSSDPYNKIRIEAIVGNMNIFRDKCIRYIRYSNYSDSCNLRALNLFCLLDVFLRAIFAGKYSETVRNFLRQVLIAQFQVEKSIVLRQVRVAIGIPDGWTQNMGGKFFAFAYICPQK